MKKLRIEGTDKVITVSDEVAKNILTKNRKDLLSKPPKTKIKYVPVQSKAGKKEKETE